MPMFAREMAGAPHGGDAVKDEFARLCREIPRLPPFQALIAYRDAVRLEGPYVLGMLSDPVARRKYSTYLKRFTQAPPRRYFTDHNYAQKLVPATNIIRRHDTMTVLDAACGNGFEALFFALHGKRVYANDVSSVRTAIATARRDLYAGFAGTPLDLTVTCGNAIDLRGAVPRMDVVYVQEAISHIHPAEAFVQEVAAGLLTADGRFIVCDSNGWNPLTRARISAHLWRERRTLRHYVEEQVDPETGRKYLMAEERLFSPMGISRVLKQAGLAIERVEMSGFVLRPMITSPPTRVLALDRVFATIPIVRQFGGFYTVVARMPRGGPLQ
jgi:SAM-dependent methyltransferase